MRFLEGKWCGISTQFANKFYKNHTLIAYNCDHGVANDNSEEETSECEHIAAWK